MVSRKIDDQSPDLVQQSIPKPVEILILGAGWTSTFLIPLLQEKRISFAATSTTGRDGTIPFRFDADSKDASAFKTLPEAKTILITFPLKGEGQSRTLVDLYEKSRTSKEPALDSGVNETTAEAGDYAVEASANVLPERPRALQKRLYIQLGSTGIFTAPHWNDYTSSYDKTNARAIAEDELLSLSKPPKIDHSTRQNLPSTTTNLPSTTVLNLAGLYGGSRDPKSWLPRIIKTKADIAGRKALHLIHGRDVAGAILAAHEHPNVVNGRRWVLTDLHVYDWWELIYEWAGLDRKEEGPASQGIRFMELGGEKVDLQQAVFHCMEETEVRALPRGPQELGRVLDGRDFWRLVGSWPVVGRVT